MTIGPSVLDHEAMVRGDCPDCGLQCSPSCGLHPLGCVFGGFSYGYWLIAEGCTLDHGEGRGWPE